MPTQASTATFQSCLYTHDTCTFKGYAPHFSHSPRPTDHRRWDVPSKDDAPLVSLLVLAVLVVHLHHCLLVCFPVLMSLFAVQPVHPGVVLLALLWMLLFLPKGDLPPLLSLLMLGLLVVHLHHCLLVCLPTLMLLLVV